MGEFLQRAHMTEIAWPRKTRELHNHHFDSTVWNDFKFRDDDIVIATCGKSGTTWTQQIVGQLLFNGDESVAVGPMSPWLDLRIPPKEIKYAGLEAQTHRRFIKTHLPVDALVFSPKAKYIYVGRDGRDMAWSLYNHHINANDVWYGAMNGPGLVGPPIERTDLDVVPYFSASWLAHDWLSVLVAVGECAQLVGGPRPAEREADPFRQHEKRSRGRNAWPGEIPRHPNR